MIGGWFMKLFYPRYFTFTIKYHYYFYCGYYYYYCSYTMYIAMKYYHWLVSY